MTTPETISRWETQLAAWYTSTSEALAQAAQAKHNLAILDARRQLDGSWLPEGVTDVDSYRAQQLQKVQYFGSDVTTWIYHDIAKELANKLLEIKSPEDETKATEMLNQTLLLLQQRHAQELGKLRTDEATQQILLPLTKDEKRPATQADFFKMMKEMETGEEGAERDHRPFTRDQVNIYYNDWLEKEKKEKEEKEALKGE
ncbi:hypothetical protein CJU90_3394 [Yarrowia sp. C11]|nr:hypothetical protein CKK34_4841 [Yarrowia sp. E02]KAG5369856.1 hypothetical protein CJU90_3394 [Yarrowia sp. C11]